MYKKDVIISQGSRTLLENIIAAACYTIALFCIYQIVIALEHVVGYAYIGTTSVMLGLRFSISKNYRFNFKANRFRDMSAIGLIEWGDWIKYDELNYVAVFLNAKDFYEVNLWYDENRRFNLSNYAELDDALMGAKEITQLLALDLYDAGTDAYNGRWEEVQVK
ncbi:hypothetical protein [uncultured Dokdonia sp.]|uniref:hypothetical protein n=1 Tax=uncultured Dokdonia sp. TaxID=575653 RepID=UPI0030ED1B0A|tara:strand:+ start:178896 stop:179387 length:492 start_codon:yes stop_codon:yes gene_type:complete